MLFPFRNLNNQEDNEFLVDGIVDDIITELSMINSIEVMSRETTFDLKEKKFEIKEVTENYNLNYFVTGSIRSAGKKVRVNAELSDPTGHGSLWSARFDKIMDDVFEIQDELVRKISESVLNEIEVTSLNRAKRKPTEDLNSYEFLLKGKFHKKRKVRKIKILQLKCLPELLIVILKMDELMLRNVVLWEVGYMMKICSLFRKIKFGKISTIFKASI